MHGRCFKHIIAALILLLPGSGFALPNYGATLSYALIPKDPPNVHGFQLMLNYDPDRFKWRQFDVYFDGGYSFFRDSHAAHNTSISVYSFAPVVRHLFKKRKLIHPYLELSIGVAWMNQTRLATRNLGMHFSFQDRLGVGALFGNKEQFLLGVQAIHYSNAHFCDHNSGFTIPVLLDFGYRFV